MKTQSPTLLWSEIKRLTLIYIVYRQPQNVPGPIHARTHKTRVTLMYVDPIHTHCNITNPSADYFLWFVDICCCHYSVCDLSNRAGIVYAVGSKQNINEGIYDNQNAWLTSPALVIEMTAFRSVCEGRISVRKRNKLWSILHYCVNIT